MCFNAQRWLLNNPASVSRKDKHSQEQQTAIEITEMLPVAAGATTTRTAAAKAAKTTRPAATAAR